MIIYYTDEYSGGRDESHELLARAIGMYLEERRAEAGTASASVAGAVRAEELMNDIETGDLGKPSIPGFDDFSISHTDIVTDEGKKYIWAVLFDRKNCGLDVQFARKTAWENIAERWFAESEKQYLKNSENAEQDFFRIWARRESLVKAVGTTIVNSSLPSTLNEEVEFEAQKWHIRDIDIPGFDSLAVAVCSTESEIIYVRKMQ